MLFIASGDTVLAIRIKLNSSLNQCFTEALLFFKTVTTLKVNDLELFSFLIQANFYFSQKVGFFNRFGNVIIASGIQGFFLVTG